MSRAPLSLRSYLLFLLLGAVAPGVLLTAILISRTVAADRAVLERRLLDTARIDAAALDREFEGTIRALQALATSPLLSGEHLEPFHVEAKRVQETQPSWYTVVVLSLDGRQLLNTARPWGEPLPRATEPESVRELVDQQRPIVGRVRQDPRGPERRFAVRVPVIRDGTLKYVLSAAIDVNALAALVRDEDDEVEGWTRAILDPDGAVAARSTDPQAQAAAPVRTAVMESTVSAGPGQVVRHTTNDGRDIYAALSRSTFGWTALVMVPDDVLDAAARGSLVALLSGGVALMLGGLLAAVVISRRLQRDFTSAARAADALAHGGEVDEMPARIAESRRLRDALQRTAALLQQRARERDEQIARAEAARAEAEQANRTKDHFLAVLGHELRNPLAPAITALELMKRHDATAFARERQVLERQLTHMIRLVDDLLDVSRLARGMVQLRVRRVALRDAVDRAVDIVRALVEQSGHDLRTDLPDAPLLLDADEDRIVQVLVNLLVNAAKYTPAPGRIALAAHARESTVVIVCEDNGPGVPPELMTALFEPFAQGPRSIDRRHGGLGLGLALARGLTELHGGTIRVENRSPEPGSRFIVELPLATADAAIADTPDQDVQTLTVRHRILVVDDNDDAREMLCGALQTLGQAVSSAADGPAALSTAAAFRPDVAILDIGLPGMNGYELARVLRQAHPDIQLIAVTGFGQPGNREEAARAGFAAYLVKPVPIASLVEQLNARDAATPDVRA
jgi:signal transduction histidine kinase/ActR/RegA family two-component response regulator